MFISLCKVQRASTYRVGQGVLISSPESFHNGEDATVVAIYDDALTLEYMSVDGDLILGLFEASEVIPS